MLNLKTFYTKCFKLDTALRHFYKSPGVSMRTGLKTEGVKNSDTEYSSFSMLHHGRGLWSLGTLLVDIELHILVNIGITELHMYNSLYAKNCLLHP